MAEIVAFDPRYFRGRVRTGVDDIVGDRFALFLNVLNVAVKARLGVQRTRNADLEHHVAALGTSVSHLARRYIQTGTAADRHRPSACSGCR